MYRSSFRASIKNEAYERNGECHDFAASKNDLFMTIKNIIDDVLLVIMFLRKIVSEREKQPKQLSEFAKDKIKIGL